MTIMLSVVELKERGCPNTKYNFKLYTSIKKNTLLNTIFDITSIFFCIVLNLADGKHILMESSVRPNTVIGLSGSIKQIFTQIVLAHGTIKVYYYAVADTGALLAFLSCSQTSVL